MLGRNGDHGQVDILLDICQRGDGILTDNDASNSLFFPAQYRLDWGSGWAQWCPALTATPAPSRIWARSCAWTLGS